MYSECDNCCSQQLGFPIRTSPDHRLLASPRGLSQLATSFIAYLRQGIHTHALSSLTIKFTTNTNLSKRSTPYIGCMACFATYLCCPSIFNCQRSSKPFTGCSVYRSFGFGNRRTDELNNRITAAAGGGVWWAWVDLNYRPRPYQGRALAT
jgi:hypothetical protein